VNNTKLRKQFEEWAAPLRATPPPPLATIQRRARLRIGRIGAAAASAAAVIVLAAVLAVTGLGGGAPRPSTAAWGSGPYPAPASQPYVYVSFSLGPTAQIRNAATGAILATLRPPSPTTTFGVAAASATDRLFVVAENPSDGTVTFAAIRILAASDGGTPKVRMTPVPHVVLPNGTQVTDLVVNAAGNRFALESQAPDGELSLSIYNLLDGSLIGRWPAGTVQLTSPLAFLPNGNLAVVWAIKGPTASQSSHVSGSNPVTSSPPTSSPSTGSPSGGGSPSPSPQFELVNRIVNPAVPFRPGSSLDVDSQPDTALHRRIGTMSADANVNLSAAQAASSTAQISPGGSVGGAGSGTAVIAESSTATGALLHLIPIGPASALNAPEFCGVLWASADGNDLLTQCGTRQQEVIDGKVTVVRLAWIFPTSAVGSVSPFAW
jgi:hypothetical protein